MAIAIFLLFISIGLSANAVRPSFDSKLHMEVDKLKLSDETTGLPKHLNDFKLNVDVGHNDALHGESLTTRTRRLLLELEARLHPTACIALDSILVLESVKCYTQPTRMLVLSFNSTNNAELIFNNWIESNAQYVNGGPEWGCLNETTQQPAVIFERISKYRLQNKKIIVETIDDANINPLTCFSNISMNFTLEQANIRIKNYEPSSFSVPLSSSEPEKSKRTRTSRGISIFSSWDFTVRSPSGNEVFYPGQTVSVSWSYSNIDDGTSVKVTLYRKQTLLDASISSMNTEMRAKGLSFTIPSTLSTSSANQYYFEFSFKRLLIPQNKKSGTFSIPTLPSIIPGSSPATNDIFYPGDTVPVTWQNFNFPNSAQITIRFRRHRPIIPDATLATFSKPATANSINYLISSTIDKADNDQYYYFEFDYCTSWLSFNCKLSSNRFFVLTRPYLVPTFPSVGTTLSTSQSVKLTWTKANFASDSEIITIKLRRRISLLPDSDVDTFTCTVGSSGSCSRTLPAVSQSFPAYYFEFNWCKHWYSTDCTAISNEFTIPSHYAGSWNYDSKTNKAVAPKTLHISSCTNYCPSTNTALSFLCDVCAKYQLIELKANCTNCWATVDYSILQLSVFGSDTSPSLNKIVLRMNTAVFINIDVLVSGDFRTMLYKEIELVAVPLITPVPIVMGPIKFPLGLYFVPTLILNVTTDGSINMTTGADYLWKSNLTLVMTPDNTIRDYKHSLTSKVHSMDGDIETNIMVKIALRPSIQLYLSFITIDLGTDAYLAVKSMFRSPPWSALSSPNLDWNPQKPSPLHVSIPSNACLTTHHVEYEVTLGIEKTNLIVKFTKDAQLVSNFRLIVKVIYETESIFDLGPYSLCSGCAYPVYPTNDTQKTVYLVLNKQYDSNNVTFNRYTEAAIVTDVAKALNVSLKRIYYNSTFSVLQNRMTGITLLFLPIRSLSTIESRAETMLTMFRAQLNNSRSQLYSGVVTRLLDFQQTLLLPRSN